MIPNRFTDPVGYRKWEWTQLSADELLTNRQKASDTLAYLDRNVPTLKANGVYNANVDAKNRRPHLAIIEEIDAELAYRQCGIDGQSES